MSHPTVITNSTDHVDADGGPALGSPSDSHVPPHLIFADCKEAAAEAGAKHTSATPTQNCHTVSLPSRSSPTTTTIAATTFASGQQDWDWSLESVQLYGLEQLAELPFSNVPTLLEELRRRAVILDANSSSSLCYCIFRNVTPENIQDIDKHQISAGTRFRVAFYFSNTRLLVLKMVGCTHELLHRELGLRIYQMAASAGLSADLATMGATRYTAASAPASPTSSTPFEFTSKEPDCAFRPRTARAGIHAWPTVVIEAGDSSSSPALYAAAKWWLEKSGGQVKVVLLPTIDRKQQSIRLELWQHVRSTTSRPTTRAPSVSDEKINPGLIKSLEIKPREVGASETACDAKGHSQRRSLSQKEYQVVVTEGEADKTLVIPFRDIFLRDPSNPREKDFVFTESDLMEYAYLLWQDIC